MTQDFSALPDLTPGLPGASLPESAGPDILALLLGAAKRWRLALGIFSVVLVTAAFIFHLMPARYRSGVEILMYDPQRPPDIVSKDTAVARDFDTVAMNTQIQVFESVALAQRVIKDLNLEDVPEFRQPPLLSRLHAQFNAAFQHHIVCPVLGFIRNEPDAACVRPAGAGASASPEAKEQNDAIVALQNHFSVYRVPLTYVLYVSAWSRDPKLAQALASTLVNDYLADQDDVRTKVLTEQSVWLKARIHELKARIADSDAKIAALTAASGIQDAGSEALTERQMAQLNEQATAAGADVAEKKARLDQAYQSLAAGRDLALGGNDAPSAQSLNQLQSQRSMLAQQEATLRATLGGGHIRVMTLQAQVAELDKAIKEQSQRAVADLQASYDIAVRRQKALQQDLQKLTVQRTNSAAYVRVQELSRAQVVDRKQYDAFLARFNEIEAIRSADVGDKRIISPAGLSTSPYFPTAKMFLGAGAAAGLMLGIAAALGLEFLLGSRAFEAKAGSLLGYPVIASLPLLSVKRNGSRRRSRKALAQSILWNDEPAARAMRDIRIAMRMPSLERMPLSVLLTSASGSSGISTVATLFASSCIAAGQRTVVVKCEFFRPGESSQKGGGGLADILAGTADVISAVRTDPDYRFDVIEPGVANARTDELLASKRMAELLRTLRSRYDYVVIDAPAIEAGAGVAALAGMADKILFVVDRNQIRAKSTRTALASLAVYRRRIVGVLLNRSDASILPQFNADLLGAMTVEFRNEPVWPPLTVVTSDKYTEAKDERA